MHIPMLSEKQRANVRRIDGDYLSQRRVSVYVRQDYVRKRLFDSMIQVLRSFIPASMLDPGVGTNVGKL